MDNPYEIYLRPLQLDDAKISYKWRNNPEIWKNTGSAPDREITEEMEMAWMRKVLADSSTKRFAICLKANDRYIGNAYLSDIVNGTAEEQIFIGETELWGNGIGTRARAILYDVASAQFGIRRIVTNIRIRNIASLKSVSKLGFVEVAHDEEWVKLEKVIGGGAIG